MDRVGFDVDAIDVFCGYGGSSQGIHAAGATVKVAANHSALALECHSANFPDTDHWQADLADPTNPQVLDRHGKKVSGRYLDPKDLPRARFAWFSPSCTHHSQANASKVYERGYQLALMDDPDWDEQAFVNSERSRVTMSCVLRYVAHNRPEIVAVENVIEVTKWGPGKNGASFRWWLDELDKLGYETRLLFLNAMFFAPCPQSRDRLFVVAWRKGNTAPDLDYRPRAYCTSDRCGGEFVDAIQTWKRPTHAWMGFPQWGKYLAQYDYRCPTCRAPVHPGSWMALSALDFSNLGQTIGERDRPLAPKTLERVRRAIKKFWWAPPVAIPEMQGVQVETEHADDSLRAGHVSGPLPSRTTKNGTALALIVKNNGDETEVGYRGHHPAGPLGALTRHPTQSLVALVPNRTNNAPHHSGGALAPVLTSATQGVVVHAAGNTSERPGQTRARHQADAMYSQTTTNEFAVAALPVLRGDHTQQAHPGEAIDTVSARGSHHALATVMWSKINGGPDDTAWHTPDDPLGTITGRDTTGLVLLPWVDQWRSEPAFISDQLATVTTHLRQSLAAVPPFEGDITDDLLMSVRFRMLEPDPELRRAMAFGDDYILLGNKGQKTAGLGNAVPPPIPAWITKQCLATLRGAA